MSLSFKAEHRDGYSIVHLAGDPSLGQFLSFLYLIGIETAGWPGKRVLFDLRGVSTLTSFTEHYAVGEEAARQLQHLHRIASVVDPDRITHASGKTARRSGPEADDLHRAGSGDRLADRVIRPPARRAARGPW